MLALTNVTLEDGTIIKYDDTYKVGSDVSVVTMNDANEEVLTPAKEGDYVLPNIGTIAVDKDGKLVSFTPSEAPKDEVVVEAAIEDVFMLQNLAEILAGLDLSQITEIKLKANVADSQVQGWELDIEELPIVDETMSANLSKANNEIETLKLELETLKKVNPKNVNLKKVVEEPKLTPHQMRLNYLQNK